MQRYSWHLLGLCEIRWTNFGETTTEEGHLLFYSSEPGRHMYGVGLLVHRDIKASVLGCRPISSRLITIRLKQTPFNITVIQAYAPTSKHSDEEVEDFYTQVQDANDKAPKKDIFILQGDLNAKVGKDAQKDWKDSCGTSCNRETNTLGNHKTSRKWTWHHPDKIRHSQVDYIMMPRHFKSGNKEGSTCTFPGADIGSDHDLVMMNY
ncbi:craniofacial development protein 2-like [Penaeus chinensis]|uniref:craniofacial development protein 2-like n=1 Tax=Penaeus chinensis TaxID=139456 RepID=UPI001FB645DC|nr:craniofacial development protein 2-like [Penaeus chinensis]